MKTRRQVSFSAICDVSRGPSSGVRLPTRISFPDWQWTSSTFAFMNVEEMSNSSYDDRAGEANRLGDVTITYFRDGEFRTGVRVVIILVVESSVVRMLQRGMGDVYYEITTVVAAVTKPQTTRVLDISAAAVRPERF
jgi:hypothetical protein